MSYRKPKYILLRMGLISLLVGIFVWSYILFWQNINRVSLSEKMVSALLENKTELAKKYAQELGLAHLNMERTEVFLQDLKNENLKLKEQVKLLDQLNEMERELSQLRDENAKIHDMMVAAKIEDGQGVIDGDLVFDSIENGNSLIQKFKAKIKAIRNRISVLRKKDRERQLALQQELDQKKMLLGNNGYVVKDGQLMPMVMPDIEQPSGDVRVKVEFTQ